MAESPSHRFGQMIGEVLETAVMPLLEVFARRHNLYLDRKGPRPARSGTKVTWTDLNKNRHDLGFVLERGGTLKTVGAPVAFIETAWRRYTKHSRNKAQEIQGAIGPLLETYHKSAPFIGVILAGVFTEGALKQLHSLGFAVVYFPYEEVMRAFQSVGLNAAFTESTPDRVLARKLAAWKRLPVGKKRSMAETLLKNGHQQLEDFMKRLESVVLRKVASIRIIPLHGMARDLPTVTQAVAFVENYVETTTPTGFVGYEIQVRFGNGDSIDGKFAAKADAVAFLRTWPSG